MGGVLKDDLKTMICFNYLNYFGIFTRRVMHIPPVQLFDNSLCEEWGIISECLSMKMILQVLIHRVRFAQ